MVVYGEASVLSQWKVISTHKFNSLIFNFIFINITEHIEVIKVPENCCVNYFFLLKKKLLIKKNELKTKKQQCRCIVNK